MDYGFKVRLFFTIVTIGNASKIRLLAKCTVFERFSENHLTRTKIHVTQIY